MKNDSLSDLFTQFKRRDRRALSRLLSWIARGDAVVEIEAALADLPTATLTVAITGSGGVGKSTLIGRLIEFLRGQQQSVAVLACDPESGLTGGALLGDRVRMPSRPTDDVLFIRSLATPPGQQSVAPRVGLMTRLLSAFGFDNVIIETVGAGQGDVAVAPLADVVVVLVQPHSGDEMQWEKAGILEIADVVVVNKADLPGADAAEGQLREHLNLPGISPPGKAPIAVVAVSANKRQGLPELWQAVQNAAAR